MKKFVVKENKIINIILADDSFTVDGCELFPANEVIGEIGWDWADGSPVEPLPPAPTENEIRAKRNKLLAESDWTQLEDTPVDKAAWATYRQNLRDITDQEGFPSNLAWPTPPT